MPAVVSDTSVLICMTAVGQLPLLHDLYTDIIVPDAVWRELTIPPAGRTGAKESIQASQEGWLKIKTPRNQPLISSLRMTLGNGEAEAIALASERSRANTAQRALPGLLPPNSVGGKQTWKSALC